MGHSPTSSRGYLAFTRYPICAIVNVAVIMIYLAWVYICCWANFSIKIYCPFLRGLLRYIMGCRDMCDNKLLALIISLYEFGHVSIACGPPKAHHHKGFLGELSLLWYLHWNVLMWQDSEWTHLSNWKCWTVFRHWSGFRVSRVQTWLTIEEIKPIRNISSKTHILYASKNCTQM